MIKSLRVWGCQVYILSYRVESGKELPKQGPKSRRGVFSGLSPAHLLNIPLMLTLITGFITQQYYAVFDDCFLTVDSGGSNDGTVELCEKLFSYSNSAFDYLNEEDSVFEAVHFEREKTEGGTYREALIVTK